MPTRLCRSCGNALALPSGYVGRVKCVRCQRVFEVAVLPRLGAVEPHPHATEELSRADDLSVPKWLWGFISFAVILTSTIGYQITRPPSSAPRVTTIPAIQPTKPTAMSVAKAATLQMVSSVSATRPSTAPVGIDDEQKALRARLTVMSEQLASLSDELKETREKKPIRKEKVGAPEVYERSRKSVVHIVTSDGAGGGGSASGVVVRMDGMIATAYHVIRDAETATVELGDRRWPVLGMVAADSERDLAIIQIGSNELMPLKLGDGRRHAVGEVVYALGFPLRLGKMFTEGILASEVIDLGPLRTTARTNHGNSGGALLSFEGEVLGIVSREELDKGQPAGIYVAESALVVKILLGDLTAPKALPGTGKARARAEAFAAAAAASAYRKRIYEELGQLDQDFASLKSAYRIVLDEKDQCEAAYQAEIRQLDQDYDAVMEDVRTDRDRMHAIFLKRAADERYTERKAGIETRYRSQATAISERIRTNLENVGYIRARADAIIAELRR